MHILQLLPALNVGGVERGVLDLARGLIARGHRVSVISDGGSLVDALVQAGAVHHALPVHRKSLRTIASLIPAVERLIRDTGVDVVHARSRVPAWIGWAAARRAQVPFVTTCHGFYAPHPASRVMLWGRTVIAPSKVLGRYLIDRFHVPPERLRVIPRGVNLEAFALRAPRAPVDGTWRLGLIGRPSPLKGHEIALRAVHQLAGRGLPVRLVLIGAATEPAPSSLATEPVLSLPARKCRQPLGGRPRKCRAPLGARPTEPPIRMHQRLMQLAKELEVDRLVEWLPIQADIPACLASLDMVLVPSTYPESFGRSVIEAQAVGVPVIASRIGALGELIEDGVTGVLVPARDPSALAQAVERVMREEELRQRCIRQARRRVEERYNLAQMVEQTEAVYRDCLIRPRIMVWKLSAAGDVVLATPSLRAIRRQFPESLIHLVVGRGVRELVARCPYVDEVLAVESGRLVHRWRAWQRLWHRLRRAHADLSIDLQNSRFTHLFAWLAGISVRVGYDRRWGRLLNRAVSMPHVPMHPVAHQQQVLAQAGVRPDGDRLELWPTEEDHQRAAQLLTTIAVNLSQALIGFSPSASPRWKTKRWPVERWAALCDRLAASGAQMVFTGTAEEQPLAQAIAAHATHKPFLLAGQTTWTELACVIRRCQVFVTGDSAPLHIAAAMGTPTVALFGPTDPARHVPHGAAVQVVRKPVPCSPCYSTWCKTVTHACMNTITVDEVYIAAREFLRLDAGHR